MQVSVKSDAAKLVRHLNYLEKKQIPFATSKAINNVLVITQQSLNKSTRGSMDRPTSFSQKSVLYERSNKRQKPIRGLIKLNPIQESYLKYIIYGKSEPGSVVPSKASRNKFGSITRKYVANNVKKANFFVGKPSGGGKNSSRPAGLYERTNVKRKRAARGLKLHASFQSNIKHRKVWDFHGIGKRIIKRHFAREMDKELALALKTARR